MLTRSLLLASPSLDALIIGMLTPRARRTGPYVPVTSPMDILEADGDRPGVVAVGNPAEIGRDMHRVAERRLTAPFMDAAELNAEVARTAGFEPDGTEHPSPRYHVVTRDRMEHDVRDYHTGEIIHTYTRRSNANAAAARLNANA